MAKKKQEQQEQSQDEHVMAVLDKRTNKTAVISKMNEQVDEYYAFKNEFPESKYLKEAEKIFNESQKVIKD